MKAPRMGAGAVKKPGLTDWVCATKPPAIPGFYDYRYAHGKVFNAKWTGTQFEVFDPELPFCDGQVIEVEFGEKWRGLAADPSKAGGK